MKKEYVSDISEISKIISEVRWSDYETAFGSACEKSPLHISAGSSRAFIPAMPDLLKKIFSSDVDEAYEAAHDIWCGLCEDHGELHSAALPACDIIIEALRVQRNEIKVELLDILGGFAFQTGNCSDESTWQGKIRWKLKRNKDYFRELSESENKNISDFAKNILEII